jgi:hypothetical protein
LVLSTVIALAGELVNPRHGHHAAGGGRRAFEKLAPVAVRTGHLLAVNLLAALATLLLNPRVERLPVGAGAGLPEGAVLRLGFGHNL